ncbi:YceD family protein [Aurantiacibacter poecillastricola]|uniref:YceD family protein n=1 Tax=Aurantiacibacter poecillastricola TaxID=3064385 RepID=UPI00273E791D|nr:DUF177 domain-containing protein [Aurantiacibacter sp. 219JJ12-13]MDP5263182.1 DUF177 domain-containing protein [Aurantiacibacter sp. 219JJ12-13]
MSDLPAMPAPELSRPIDIRGITDKPVVIEANEAERGALARRFGLVSLDSLTATLVLDTEGSEVNVTGPLRARIVQSCAVSGEDLPVTIVEEIALRFVPESDWAEEDAEEVELSEDELDAVPYDGTQFDLGEAVAQSLGLAIDPYAVGPEADEARRRHGLVEEGEPNGPLADALRGLKGS